MNRDKIVDDLVSVWTLEYKKGNKDSLREIKNTIRNRWPSLAVLLDALCRDIVFDGVFPNHEHIFVDGTCSCGKFSIE